MKPIALLVLLSLFSPILSGHVDQGGKGTESPVRDLKLERAAAARYRKIGALLQPEAKRKLAAASSEVLRSLARNSNAGDPLVLVRAQVKSQFEGLSDQQADLLSFYVLDDFAQLLVDQDSLKQKLDGMNEMSEMT